LGTDRRMWAKTGGIWHILGKWLIKLKLA